MKTTLWILAMILMAFLPQRRQSINIKGSVFDDASGIPLPGVTVTEKNTANHVLTDRYGMYAIAVSGSQSRIVFSKQGYLDQEFTAGNQSIIDVRLKLVKTRNEAEAVEPAISPKELSKRATNGQGALKSESYLMMDMADGEQMYYREFNTEEYSPIAENIFHRAMNNPLSTFSIDVDAASYSNVRRFITNGQLPPKDAVRIEEMINYFRYTYPQPQQEYPFSINTEVASAGTDRVAGQEDPCRQPSAFQPGVPARCFRLDG
jgi:Ca-activated chloride channel family protein